MQSWRSKVIPNFERPPSCEVFPDQYTRTRIAFFLHTTVPKLKIGREPLSELVFDARLNDCLVINLSLVYAQDVRLILLKKVHEVHPLILDASSHSVDVPGPYRAAAITNFLA